jgi:hypothetical protein
METGKSISWALPEQPNVMIAALNQQRNEALKIDDSETKSSTRSRGYLLCIQNLNSGFRTCDIVFQ